MNLCACQQEQQSKLEAAVSFLDAAITHVSAAHKRCQVQGCRRRHRWLSLSQAPLENADSFVQEQQSKLEAAVIFLDAVVTQVSAAHLQAGAARNEGILRELESLLQEVS